MAQFSVKVRPVRDFRRGKTRWVVDIHHSPQKRIRFFYPTKEQAERATDEKRTEILNMGLRAFNLTYRLKLEALDATDRLAPFQVTLTQVVDHYLETKEFQAVPVCKVTASFLESRQRLRRSERHLNTLRLFFARFDQVLGEKMIGRIYAVGKGYCRENPVTKIELVKEEKEKAGIISPEQMKMLLASSKDDVRATFAIGGFAGLRPEEIARLTWEEIDLEEGLIDVSAKIPKHPNNDMSKSNQSLLHG